MTIEELKAKIASVSPEEFVQEVVLAGDALHVTGDSKSHIQRDLAETFNVPPEDIALWIVGSAKLGYALTPKTRLDGTSLPRFRAFSGSSDIDVVVISSQMFDLFWSELSIHASFTPRMPWASNGLGDYLVHGWLRPDKFPRGLRRCDLWWDRFRHFSRQSRFSHRKVRGGLFYSIDDLVRYQSRGVSECKRALEVEE